MKKVQRLTTTMMTKLPRVSSEMMKAFGGCWITPRERIDDALEMALVMTTLM